MKLTAQLVAFLILVAACTHAETRIIGGKTLVPGPKIGSAQPQVDFDQSSLVFYACKIAGTGEKCTVAKGSFISNLPPGFTVEIGVAIAYQEHDKVLQYATGASTGKATFYSPTKGKRITFYIVLMQEWLLDPSIKRQYRAWLNIRKGGKR